MTKRIGFSVVLAAAMFAAGCASTGDVGKVSARVNSLETQLAEQLAAKADKAEVARVAKSLETVNAKAGNAAATVNALKGRADRTDTAIADLRTKQTATDANVARLDGEIKATGGKLAALEKNVVGVRRLAAGAVARIGTLEDQGGVDNDKKIFRLTGFPTARLNADGSALAACAEVSKRMKARIAEISSVLKKGGWKVSEVIGFADERSFRKDGKVLGNSDEFNATCATNRAEAVAGALDVDGNLAVGRGATTKFGELDMNRSVLIYLERVAQQPAAPAAPAQATPTVSAGQQTAPAAAAPATSAASVPASGSAQQTAPAAPAAQQQPAQSGGQQAPAATN